MKTMLLGRKALLSSSAVAAALGAGLFLIPVLAHHASAPFYDPENRVEIQGTVSRFVFRNPHAYLFVEVPGEGGETIEWQVELGAPISLRRTGWTPDSLTPGTVVRMTGNKSRVEGSYGLCCVRMTREDGSPILSGGRVEEEDVQ